MQAAPRIGFGARSPFALSLLMCLAMLFTVACAEEGDPLSGDAGSVSVFMTDSPSDDFLAVNITVHRIELRGGTGGPVTIFEGLETFDLLNLRDVAELFAQADDVRPGKFSKIRMYVDDIELVIDDGEGGFETQHPKLPANGKLDMNPRGPFHVRHGELLLVMVDVDVEKSFYAHRAGHKDKWLFRPVIFVKILDAITDGRLVRMHGTVRNMDVEAGTFDLCHPRRPLAWLHALRKHGNWREHEGLDDDIEGAASEGGVHDGREDDADSDSDSDSDSDHGDRPFMRRCTDVVLVDDPSIFDESGEPARVSAIENGDEVSIVGRATQGRERRVAVLTKLVLIGQQGTFTNLRGVVASEYDEASDQFDLAIAPGQGFDESSEITVQLYDTSLLYSRTGMPLTREHIEIDLRARSTGVISLSGEGNVIKTAVLILDIERHTTDKLEGLLAEVDAEARRLLLKLDESDELACVDVPEYAKVIAVDADEGTADEVALEELVLRSETHVFGRPGAEEGDCFVAQVVISFAESDEDGGDE
jgi:hypothetical protein